jgi:hypothetical protein
MMHVIWVGVKIDSGNQNMSPATDWHDGQFVHGTHTRLARRARALRVIPHHDLSCLFD